MKQVWRNFLMIDIPLLILMSQLLIEFIVPTSEKAAFNSEGGPTEAVQFIFLMMAIPFALYLAFKVQNKWLKLWSALAALCCIYVAGEEISWGQHLFHWGTPENWSAINDQDETNLHNTSTWLDQKPRAIFEIGVLVGGIIIPALRKWMPSKLPEKFREIYPDNIVVFTAACALFVKISLVMADITGFHLFWRGSEVLELYLYYFVFLYLFGRKDAWSNKGFLKG